MSHERAQAAARFAGLGCRIVPAAGKNPGGYLGRGWQHKATRDRRLIQAWWEAWPDANVAIVPDRALLPVDVDNPENFRAFQSVHGQAPRTPRYLSGGDGGRERLLFQFPGDHALRGVSRKLAPGVQLRHAHATSMICIVPPGINPDTGRSLEWTVPIQAPLAELPDSWLHASPRPGETKPAGEWARIARGKYVTGCGQTHPDVLSFAAYLMAKLGDGPVVHELLLSWVQGHCQPPKPRHEVEAIVQWIEQAEDRKYASRANRARPMADDLNERLRGSR